jgi:hypothetical protein
LDKETLKKASSGTQALLDQFAAEVPNADAKKIDPPKEVEDACVDLITGANLPVSFFEGESVDAFLNKLVPIYSFPKKNKMRRLIMDKAKDTRSGAFSLFLMTSPHGSRLCFLPSPPVPPPPVPR